MRIIAAVLIALLVPCTVFAYSDLGLLKNQKTIGCFILSPTNSTNISAGLVYNQKQNEKLAFEVLCTNYYKVYPFTKNVIKIMVDGKYKLFERGPATVTVLAGPVIYYAPGIGAGLATNIGGIIHANIFDNLVVSMAVNGIIFGDGIGGDAEPGVSFAPAFLKNTEFYGGVRLEASMIGFTFDDVSSGKINYYLITGVRIGI